MMLFFLIKYHKAGDYMNFSLQKRIYFKIIKLTNMSRLITIQQLTGQ